MTDGCGRINRAALRIIQRHQGLSHMPTAIQGRIAGAKGLWVVDEHDLSEAPKIWITASQVKIKYSSDELDHPARRILDLVRTSKVKSPARLGNQPITNLSHNGVPPQVFQDLLREALSETLDATLSDWATDNTLRLFELVSTRGVNAIKRQRATGKFIREFGHVPDKEKGTTADDARDEDLGGVVDEPVEGPDPFSGWPSDLGEQVVELFQAGFTPQDSPLLAKGLKAMLKKEVDRMTSKNAIPIRRSAEAFAAPGESCSRCITPFTHYL